MTGIVGFSASRLARFMHDRFHSMPDRQSMLTYHAVNRYPL
jgi:hypothetical protein